MIFRVLIHCLEITEVLEKKIQGGGDIAEKNLRNFMIFSLIPASAHITDRANIAEISLAFAVFITDNFKCVMNAGIIRN